MEHHRLSNLLYNLRHLIWYLISPARPWYFKKNPVLLLGNLVSLKSWACGGRVGTFLIQIARRNLKRNHLGHWDLRHSSTQSFSKEELKIFVSLSKLVKTKALHYWGWRKDWGRGKEEKKREGKKERERAREKVGIPASTTVGLDCATSQTLSGGKKSEWMSQEVREGLSSSNWYFYFFLSWKALRFQISFHFKITKEYQRIASEFIFMFW